MAHHPVGNHNDADTEHFQDVLARSQFNHVNRRQVIRGGVGLAALSTIPFLPGCGGGSDAADLDALAKARGNIKKNDTLGFEAIDKRLLDEVVLPAGYTFTVVHATGDQLTRAVMPYANDGSEDDDWSERIGDHHDGMDLFYIGANGRYTDRDTGRALLVVNHESSADAHFFHPTGQTSGGVPGKKFSQFGGWDGGARPVKEILKEINHHGVSIVELERIGGQWGYKIDSPYNRRVNGQSPMRISGPAAHIADIRSFMVTLFNTKGETSRGTLNNCGHGKTPWGTYLACEENWAFYFNNSSDTSALTLKERASRQRYGVALLPYGPSPASTQSQGWYRPEDADPADVRFARFDIAPKKASALEDFRNEPNTFGYNVEIDPLSSGMSVKRVAMGRFAHEAAVCSLPQPGKPLAFYMGCDSQNEYIYKFVTDANWDPADIGRGIAAGDKYLDEGKLYAAKFNDDGTGEWLELNIDKIPASYTAYTFANQADVLVNTRHAATALGATRMDRPEWGAVNPKNGEVYFTLTNNASRATKDFKDEVRTLYATDAANPRAYNDLLDGGAVRVSRGEPVGGNPNGHIIRFKESSQTPSIATAFKWDIFLFGAESVANPKTNLSELTADNDFSSPDGLWFSQATGICWIQTDDGAFTDKSNCMLLAAIPGSVGDGKGITVENRLEDVTVAVPVTVPRTPRPIIEGTQDTFIGATLGDAKLRRFLVGPRGCEVTGITETPDGKTLFVNIQHPGEGTGALGSAADFTNDRLQSRWPSVEGYGPGNRPRSATIAITREDGGVIGL